MAPRSDLAKKAERMAHHAEQMSDVADALARAESEVDRLQRRRVEIALEARADGITWQAIADQFGFASRQAARKRIEADREAYVDIDDVGTEA